MSYLIWGLSKTTVCLYMFPFSPAVVFCFCFVLSITVTFSRYIFTFIRFALMHPLQNSFNVDIWGLIMNVFSVQFNNTLRYISLITFYLFCLEIYKKPAH